MHSELASNSTLIPVSGRAGSKGTVPHVKFDHNPSFGHVRAVGGIIGYSGSVNFKHLLRYIYKKKVQISNTCKFLK